MSERKVAFKALVGSHNYLLNTEESDKDYKVFVFPTYEDLYKGKMYSHSSITKTEDTDYHDIRKLGHLFYKANLNFIEVLYSKEIIFSNELSASQRTYLDKIFAMKQEIVKMNLPYLYNACYGMHMEKMKQLNKGTEGTKHLVEQFGYDTKQALHAFRVLDFIIKFDITNFEDFEKAMTYTEQSDREFVLDIKRGHFMEEPYRKFISHIFNSKFVNLQEKYCQQPVNEELKETLDQLIMDLVKDHICS